MEENIQKSLIPWEQRKEIGIFQALWQTIKQVLFHPGDFFNELEISKAVFSPYLFYAVITVPVAFIGIFYEFIFRGPPAIFIKYPMFAFLLVIFSILAGIFITSAFVHVSVLIYGGKGGYKGTFNILSYATAAHVFNIVPIFGGLISGIWGIVVAIIGLKRVHQFSTARAICAYFLNPLVIILLLAAIAIPSLLRARLDANETTALANLQVISAAVESYVTANKGKYPKDEFDLKISVPPYLAQTYDKKTIQGYIYTVNFKSDGYEVIAAPQNCNFSGRSNFTIKTGGKITTDKCKNNP